MAKMTADDWLTEIDNGLEYRRIFAREDKWKSLEDSYLNDPTSDTAIGPNLMFSMGDSLLSSLTVPDPEISVIPEHRHGVDRAPVVESVDNWLIRKLGIKNHVDLALLNSFIQGRAILKIGYDSEFGFSPYYDLGSSNEPKGMTLTQFDKKGNRIESKNTMPGMPWVSVVAGQDFVVPWGTIFLDDAPWAAHRIIRRNKDIKADPKYSNTARLEPDLSMESFMGSYSKVQFKKRQYTRPGTFNSNQKPEFNELWEIRDRMTGRVIVVTPNYEKKLRDDFDALQVCGMPFVSTTFVSHPRSFWSTPLAYYLGQLQHTQFDISKQAEKQRRINCLKFLADKGAITPIEAEKLVSGDVGAIAWAETGRPLKDVFVPFPQGNMYDFIMQSNNNRQDAREVVGYGRNQMGEESQSSRRTAREVTFIQQGSERRAGRRQSAVIDLYINAIKKINKICFRYWRTPRFAMKGNEWVQFSGEELEGDYLYDVTLANKRVVGQAQRKVEALQVMLQFLAIPGINHQAIFKYIMDASGDPAFERILGMNQQGGQAGGLPTIPASGQGGQPSA